MTDELPANPSTARRRWTAALAALGWNVVMALGAVLWVRSVPVSSPNDPCSAVVFGCPRDAALLAWTFFGVPVLVVSALLSPALAWWLVRGGTRRPMAAGTWSAALSLVASAVVVALCLLALSL